MRYITIGAVFFVCAIIQTGIVGYIDIFGIRPNLFITLITCFALLGRAAEGAVIGFIAGIIQDMTMGYSLGGYAVLGMYLGLIVGILNTGFVKENLLVAIAFVFGASIAYETIFYFLVLFISGQTDILLAFRKIILPEAVYNSLAALLFFPIVVLIDGWLRQRTKTSKRY